MKKVLSKYQLIEKYVSDHDTKIVFAILLSSFFFLLIMSFFRFALYDELLYLRETVLMSELLKSGVWFGDYGVGIHGFLFKLPVALIYLITGPSVFVATFFHVILATLSAWLFFRILKDNLNLKAWSLTGLLLLVVNYSFVSWAITFHRETPSLFAILLFLRLFLNKKSNLLLGLSLLLVLDAKEYVFFIIAPAFMLWLIYFEFQNTKKLLLIVKKIIIKSFLVFLPSLIYTLLMFFTSIIPVNMFLASILNLTQNGLTYQLEHLEPINYVTKDVSFFAKSINNASGTVSRTFDFIPYIKNVVYIISYLTGYFEKIFFQFLFSFQAIPIVVLIPSLIFSFRYLFIWNKLKKHHLVFLVLLLWFFTFVFFIKVSHQRYLQPFIPLTIIFFILFLRNVYEKTVSNRFIVILCSLILGIATLSLIYPGSDIYRKSYNFLGNITITSLILFAYKKNSKIIFKYLLFTIYFFFFSVVIIASATKTQLYKSLVWGTNGQTKKIASYFQPADIIYVNQSGIRNFDWNYTISFYRKDLSLEPEWRWKLKNFVIKKSLLKTSGEEKSFYFNHWENSAMFKRALRNKGINKIVIIASTLPDIKFFMQDKIPEFLNQEWLKLDSVTKLKNKDVYIFSVVPAKL